MRAQNWNNRQDYIDTCITSLRFAVVGAGRLGASLALALRDRGAHLLAFSAATPEGRLRAEGWLGGKASGSLSEITAADADLYLLTVPDRVLPDVATELAALLTQHVPRVRPAQAGELPGAGNRVVVAHTSGATSVRVLDGCRAAGAATLAFHPLQTFSEPATGRARFSGAAVALTPGPSDLDDAIAADSHTVEAAESVASKLGFAVASALGARPFVLPDEKRSLYHAAATVACNYLVTLEHQAERLFVAAGLPRDEALSMFLPLVEATLDNVSAQGAVKALTGPLSRGDVETISRHLNALECDAPRLLPLYRSLGLATLDIVRARDEVSAETVADLEALLDDPTRQRRPGA